LVILPVKAPVGEKEGNVKNATGGLAKKRMDLFSLSLYLENMTARKWNEAAEQGIGAMKAQGAIEWCSRTTARTLHGQGATEYLILLAVVLIIAIVVVALLGFFPGTATDARMAQSDAYWSGVANPLRITDTQPLFTGATGSVCGTPTTRGTRMAIMNGYTSQITITSLYVGNSSSQVSVGFCPANAAGTSTVTVDPGGSVLVDAVSGAGYCSGANGSLGEFYVRFTYSTPYLAGQTELGSKPLSFRC
jgi:hypothetical protein